MNQPISIISIASISPLGSTSEVIWKNYQKQQHFLVPRTFNDAEVFVGALPETLKSEIDHIRRSDTKYEKLDDCVLFALYASRNAVKNAGWKTNDAQKGKFGVNIGSSRGATQLFEEYHEAFLKTKSTPTLASPTTTLGNISSWVAHDLQTEGPEISHSITCSTALHSLLNGVAWLQSGLADRFLVGGSEAPLTHFTIAQMKALKIYAKGDDLDFPCQALNLNKTKNSMVLGEGAAMACLERGAAQNALAVIAGVGYATEPLEHNVSISTDAVCFQRSMKMALGNSSPDDVDVIVMHAPGTIKGDSTEYNAIKKVFCNKTPFLTTNKWKIGHTFGASGMLSVELAILLLQQQSVIKVPYLIYDHVPTSIKKVMVNAVGFGGNAVSILLKTP